MAHPPRCHRFLGIASALVTGLGALAAASDIPLRDWTAPPRYSPPRPAGTRSLLADAGSPSPFIPITPCRIADTRGLGFTGQAGPPALAANVARSFQIGGAVPGVTTQCGIPSNAEAVSFNFAVTNITANGNLVVYPQSGAAPVVSSLNYQSGFAALSNAAVIPLGASSGITVKVNGTGTVDVIIDVNGYYGPSPSSASTFRIDSSVRAGEFHTTGSNLSALTGVCDTNNTSCSAIGATTGTGNWALTASSGRGISSVSFDPGSPAVGGLYASATGQGHGVEGNTFSTDGCSAGVAGTAGSSPTCPFVGTGSGVVGSTNGTWGVLGFSDSRGIQGARVNSGVAVTSGVLGYSGSSGVHSFQDITAAGTKSFVEPHPTDSTRQINFISTEANEPLTMFRGRGRFQNGYATIRVPEEFQLVTVPDSLSIQVTPIGDTANVGVLHIALDGITVKSSRNLEFFYLVHGTRKGFESHQAIQENTLFVPDSPRDRMPNYPEHIQRRLIDLAVYNEDGTVNMKTAEANGWAAKWRAEESAKRD